MFVFRSVCFIFVSIFTPFPPERRLSEDELNSLIAHAHRRIEQLQMQLAEQQVLEEQRTGQALQRQKEEDEKFAVDRVEREKERLRGELGIIKSKWVSLN